MEIKGIIDRQGIFIFFMIVFVGQKRSGSTSNRI